MGRSHFQIIRLILVIIFALYPAGPAKAAEVPMSLVNEPLVIYTNVGSQTIRLMLPGNWTITADGALTLAISVSLGASSNPSPLFLSVSVANAPLEMIPLTQHGVHTLKVVLPREILVQANTSGVLELALETWNASGCETWGGVTILPTSQLVIPHLVGSPSLKLAQFPRQLVGENGKFEPVLVVLPDQPTLAELQAGITLGTGLGRQTGGNLPILLVSERQLTDDLKQKYNLLYIGKTSSLDILTRLILPMPVLEDDFLLPDRYEFEHTGQTDGVIQVIVSPWNDQNVMLIVSASSEDGLQNAAKALSLGKIRTNIKENASIVKNIIVPDLQEPLNALNTSINAAGYQDVHLQRVGAQSAQFLFQIPVSSVVSTRGWVELVYEVPLLLDPKNSFAHVYLNHTLIGDLPLATTPELQKIRIPLPPELLIPGQNTLAIAANLMPETYCRSAGFQPTWLTIFATSQIKLQPGFFEKRVSIAPPTIDHAPENLGAGKDLDKVAFVLQANEAETWQAAIQLASTLGALSGDALNFPAVYMRTIPPGELAGKNIIFVGRASQFPLLSEMGAALPAPFDAFSDRPNEAGLEVVFRVSFDDPVGYLQFVVSPWDEKRLVLVVVGNTFRGVASAVAAFGDPNLRVGMKSDFVLISSDDVFIGQFPR